MVSLRLVKVGRRRIDGTAFRGMMEINPGCNGFLFMFISQAVVLTRAVRILRYWLPSHLIRPVKNLMYLPFEESME